MSCPEVLQEMANVRKRTIRVNVLAASTLVTHALISYQKSHSGLNFRLIQNSQCEDADITIFTRSFFQQPADGRGRYQIFTERIFMAVPQDSPYARCESVRLKDFAHQNFISLSGSRSIRSICDRYCQHAGFTPNIIFESDSPRYREKFNRWWVGGWILAALYMGTREYGTNCLAANF